MSSGGSTPDKTTTTTELPQWAQPYAQQLLQRGSSLSNQNMPVYTGQRTADMNGMQTQAMQMTQQRAQSGDPSITAGASSLQGTLGGDYLNHNAGTNQYMGTQPTGTNAYMGDNPYLSSSIDNAAKDITRNYNSAVNGTDATFARAGAFGGSAWQQAQQGNSHELASALDNSATTMRMQNYNQSAGLAENALNRDQQAWQTNAGLADTGLSRDLNAYQTERTNQMSALPLALQYGNQAYTDANALAGAGATQFGYDQQLLTDKQNQFNEQAQAPYASLDVLANTIRGAVGGGGSITQTAPGGNGLAQGVGAAASLYSLFGK